MHQCSQLQSAMSSLAPAQKSARLPDWQVRCVLQLLRGPKSYAKAAPYMVSQFRRSLTLSPGRNFNSLGPTCTKRH